MGYEVKLTFHATTQLQETIPYISKVLLEPEIARRWADTLQKEIASLDSIPERFPLTDYEPRRASGICKMLIKNFVVYYI